MENYDYSNSIYGIMHVRSHPPIGVQPTDDLNTLDKWPNYINSRILNSSSSSADLFQHLTECVEQKKFSNIAEQIAFIQSNLSFRIKEMSDVLKVQRPTVYSWIRAESFPQDNNKMRVNEITEYAEFWVSKSNMPLGGMVREFTFNNETIVSVLSKEKIDENQVKKHLEEIANEINKQANAKQSLSIEETARRMGIKIKSTTAEPSELILLSGKRVSVDD